MAEGIAFDLVKEVLHKLGSALRDEIEQLRSLKDDVKDLKSNFSAIQAVLLDAEERSNVEMESHSMRDWLGKLKDAAYDVDDLLDEIQTESVLQQQQPHEEQNQFLSWINPKNWMAKFNITQKMKELRENINKIAKQRHDFGLVLAGPRPQAEFKRPETFSVVDEKKIVGRDDDKEKIVKLLLDTNGDHDVSVISIVGLGGLGKTTLAQLAFNDGRVMADLRVWVCVSTDFDVKTIARSIISATGGKCDNLDNLESVVRRVVGIFSQKRFLLVLDDVWNEDQGKWEELKVLFKDGMKGSKILVTTRSEKVAEIMKTTEQLHRLKGLSDDDCWTLFKRRAFGEGEENGYPSLVEIGKQIVMKCGGVPLAANALGSMMRFKSRTEDAWSAIRDSQIWRLEEEEKTPSTEKKEKILPSLKLSYIHMPSALKQCFAYCSIFPKDYEIEKDDLIQEWIALGFISSHETSSSMEDIGNEYFNDLLWMSFLQDVEVDRKYPGSVTCRMHDLVHDLTQSVASKEVAVIVGEESTRILEGCRYASICDRSMPQVPTAVVRRLRALRFRKSAPLTTFYSEAKCLRVLDLHNSGISMLPSSIGKLKLLRYLNLSWTNIQELPESITGLCNLQTLNLSSCHHIHTLPKFLGRLANLRILNLFLCQRLQSLPSSLCQLKNLHDLNLSMLHNLQALPEFIGNLENLRILNLSKCSRLLSLPSSLCQLKNLHDLNLSNLGDLQALPESIGNLENLRILNLSECSRLLSLPSSLCQLKNLHDLNLSYLQKLQSLPESIGNLKNLRILYLSHCSSLLSLPSSLSDLQYLEKLDIRYCRQLCELPKMIQKLTKLRESLNYGCRELKGMPRGIGKLVSLQKLPVFVVGKQGSIEHCASISELKQLNNLVGELEIYGLKNVTNPVDAKAANLIEKKKLRSLRLRWNVLSAAEDMDTVQPVEEMDAVLENLQPHQNLENLVIEGYAGGKFPSWMMNRIDSCLPNLVKIKLMNIPRCSSLPSLGLLPVLEELLIWDMPAITNLGVEFDRDSHINESANKFPALWRLDLSDMPVLGEWVTQRRNKFPALVELSLKRMPVLREWVTMDDEEGRRERVPLFPCLDKLWLQDCPQLRPEPCLPASVEDLTISRTSEENLSLILERATMDIETPLDDGDGAVSLQLLNEGLRLGELTIRECQQVTCLLESLRSLTALEYLYIWDCEDLERIDDWLGELTKLNSLSIWNCRSLRYLPSHKMTTLKELYIDGCPLLFNADGQFVDTNVDHIETVQVNFSEYKYKKGVSNS